MERLFTESQNLQIVDYNPAYQVHFRSLNLAWIEKHFIVEDIDEKVLSCPEEYIYNEGGCILMALTGENVVGTVALKRMNETAFEMTKMAVDSAYQGAKVGYRLCLAVIERAKQLGAKELVLYSQTVLAPAIKLYKKMGFKEVALEAGKYKRCNIKMKIAFKEQEVILSLSSQLKTIVEESMQAFGNIAEHNWHHKPELNRWSRKEILGHLIDSAANNHQRFVRFQYADLLVFPGYEQNQWVEIQNYQNMPLSELLNVWYYYNLQLTHIIANLHYDKLYVNCVIAKYDTMSFYNLIIDYIQHLQHHVRQIIPDHNQ